MTIIHIYKKWYLTYKVYTYQYNIFRSFIHLSYIRLNTTTGKLITLSVPHRHQNHKIRWKKREEQSTNLNDFTLAPLVGASDNLDLIVLAHGNRSDVVLVAKLGGERRAHEHTAHARRSREVRLAALATGARDARVVLHLDLIWRGEERRWR